MGDPRKSKKKYRTPSHPWIKDRIDSERELSKEYGLKNKKEIWMALSKVSNFSNQAKKLVFLKTDQAIKEKELLLKRLISLGLIEATDNLDKILTLSPKDMLERRLQTVVFRKGFANSMKQARQFITHRHIIVGEKLIDSPAYTVLKTEEHLIKFAEKSLLSSAEHPESVKRKEKAEKKPNEKKIARDKRRAFDKSRGRDGRRPRDGRREQRR